MSAFSAKTFNSHQYALYRPSYSTEFYKYILEYAQVRPDAKTLSIVDIGSGPGTCAITIISYLSEQIKNGKYTLNKVIIYVTDVSETMILEAEKNINDILASISNGDLFEIKYSIIGAENIDSVVTPHSIDVVTAAQSIHWAETSKWLDCMKKILVKGTGVLAYWGYVDPVFTKINGTTEHNKTANDFFELFVYDDKDALGPHWQQPGRNILRGLYKDINAAVLKDTASWKDCVVCSRDPSKDDGCEVTKTGEAIDVDKEALKMTRRGTVENYVNYVNTWSSSYKWNQLHSEAEQANKLFYERLRELISWSLQDEIEIEFKSVYTFCKLQ